MIGGWAFMVSAQLINADSNYKFLKGMMDGWMNACDEAGEPRDSWVVLLPHNNQVTYKNDGFFAKYPDHIKAVPYPAPSGKNLHSKDFQAQRVFDITRDYGLGMFWSNIPEISGQLSELIPNYWASGDRTPGPWTVTYNHYTIHPTLPYAGNGGYRYMRVMEVLGNYMSDLAVFNSAHNERMLRDNAEEYGLSHWFTDMERRDAIGRVPIPVLDNELRPFYEETKDDDFGDTYAPTEDGVTFQYNHRLQAYKHWRDTFDLLQAEWDSGKTNFHVELSYGSGDYTKKVRGDYPFIRLRKTHEHADYYRALQKPHFNTINTTHETFCIALVESALLGGIPIVPDRVTFPEIFPDDYAFMFSSGDEQQQMIRDVLDGSYSPEYLTDVKHGLRDHFAQYNSRDVGKLAYHTVKSGFRKYALEHYGMLKHPDRLHEWLEKNEGRSAPWPEVKKGIRKSVGVSAQAIPSWRASALLELFGTHATFEDGDTIIHIDSAERRPWAERRLADDTADLTPFGNL